MHGEMQLSLQKAEKPMWNTLGGKYLYKMATPRDIEVPELYTTTVVTWIAHVDETTGKTKVAYDIITWLQ